MARNRKQSVQVRLCAPTDRECIRDRPIVNPFFATPAYRRSIVLTSRFFSRVFHPTRVRHYPVEPPVHTRFCNQRPHAAYWPQLRTAAPLCGYDRIRRPLTPLFSRYCSHGLSVHACSNQHFGAVLLPTPAAFSISEVVPSPSITICIRRRRPRGVVRLRSGDGARP